jgi:hypothetical protein
MPASLVNAPIDSLEEFRFAAESILGCPVVDMTWIGGGRNSRVYRVDCQERMHYALKVYFRHNRDPRDRRATEFAAFRFLRERGIHCVPEPLATDADLSASVFSFVDGAAASAAAATAADIDFLADFLVGLHPLCRHADATRLSLASEAVFSLEALVESIAGRQARLEAVRGNAGAYPLLTTFLHRDFRPTFESSALWATEILEGEGLQRTSDLAASARTLSPSDFGFHNALRTADGRLTIVDFEYFGWDDPAKMVSDFLLHPGMAIGDELRGRFLRRVLRGFGRGNALEARVRVAYVLFALKWCMILLNEFVPEHLERRLFANPGIWPEDLHREQLDKARQMLARARQAIIVFPYEEWIKT